MSERQEKILRIPPTVYAADALPP